MDIFRNRIMNINGGYVNYQSSVKALLKLAALKATIPVRSIIEFLAEQSQPIPNTDVGLSSPGKNRKKLPSKFPLSKNISSFNGRSHIKITGQANIIDFESGKQINILENGTDMSPAQIVYAVIHNQQVEWMDDSQRESG